MTHISTAGVQGFDSAGNTKHLIQGWKSLTSWTLNNRVEHRTNDLPPMWWPTQICCHLLHPHLPVPHLELWNKELSNVHMWTKGICSLLKAMTFCTPASSVLVLTETGLGSPTPTLFLARTLNSYSTQALRSTTVAVRVLPVMISGTTERGEKCICI